MLAVGAEGSLCHWFLHSCQINPGNVLKTCLFETHFNIILSVPKSLKQHLLFLTALVRVHACTHVRACVCAICPSHLILLQFDQVLSKEHKM
jgi:hypothetical protein